MLESASEFRKYFNFRVKSILHTIQIGNKLCASKDTLSSVRFGDFCTETSDIIVIVKSYLVRFVKKQIRNNKQVSRFYIFY